MATGTGRGTGLLGVVAGVLAVLGVLLLTLGVVGVTSTATPHMRGFTAGQSVEVRAAGLSVWARSDTARTDAVCTATREGSATVLPRPVSEFAVDVGGTPFYEVARSPESLPPGTYAVACEGTDATVYAGPRATETVARGLLGELGLVLGGVALLLGLALGVVWLTLRSRERDRWASQTVAAHRLGPPAGGVPASARGGATGAGGPPPGRDTPTGGYPMGGGHEVQGSWWDDPFAAPAEHHDAALDEPHDPEPPAEGSAGGRR